MNQEKTKSKKWLRTILIAVSALGLIVLLSQQTQASLFHPQATEPTTTLSASGVIQAEQVSLASEFGGLIADIPVAKGDNVVAGQVIVQLDTTMLDAQIEVAQAMVDMAEAGLAQARAGARPGEIATAKAQLAQAQAGQLVAQQAVSDTQNLLENPQDIDMLIAVTRAQLESAEHQLAQATALKDAIEVGKAQLDKAYADFDGGGRRRFPAAQGSLDDILDDLKDVLPDLPDLPDVDLPDIPDGDYNYGDWELTIDNGSYTLYKWVTISFPLNAMQLPNLWWQSWVGVNAAAAQKEGLEAKLADLYRQRAHPQALQTHADEALSTQAQVEARVALAQIQVDALEAGATPEQIAAIEARAAQAHSGLAALQKQRDMLALKAPIDGMVVDVTIHRGEVAAAGATILTIADLNKLTLTVYVPQNQIGLIHLNDPVQISVNSFPNRTFEGTISRIADQAEFTPRNVATQEERVNLVFAIEITVVNRDHALKMGMPADVLITTSAR
ncbi:MAG TPA: efflux RND transporter periplasmic adaptor subunit [Anaerolineae bacterium]|nr:efflux RND transporter periplasmic adaptor subunit [Anaerolineae bacterium]HQH39458.1 efflux RND transporter periplasmic adaptor subunit [Anaerolineae bacterium]